ncbi:MAG TPA: hypothetical protein VGZ22_04320 [Isosphaeraceae bacterium]|jgi:hypothetical protein|nr:hypothetical protein [Isosphaeraceae bacterium]
MASRRTSCHLGFQDAELERRDLLSLAGLQHPTTLTQTLGPRNALADPNGRAVSGNLFHQNGINGLKIHKSFDNQMNYRLSNATDMGHRVFEAFSVFNEAYFGVPSSPELGAPAVPPTLPNLLADLSQQVALAVTTIQIGSNQAGPSLVRAPKFSLRPFDGLIPFAQAQIEGMGNTLATLPANGGPQGSATAAQATAAINQADNAILNGLAEYTLHPNLFVNPSDFYISPNVSFTTSFDGNPTQAGPGYFVRGPGGQTLPGAPLRLIVR